MISKFQKYPVTLISSILTPLLLVVVVFFMGGGHGNYVPAIFLFPWGMIGMFLFQHALPTTFLAVIQYPVYGLLIDKNRNDKKQDTVIVAILLIHLILSIGGLIFFNNQ